MSGGSILVRRSNDATGQDRMTLPGAGSRVWVKGRLVPGSPLTCIADKTKIVSRLRTARGLRVCRRLTRRGHSRIPLVVSWLTRRSI